jgi:hypothetical protein
MGKFDHKLCASEMEQMRLAAINSERQVAGEVLPEKISFA